MNNHVEVIVQDDDDDIQIGGVTIEHSQQT